MGRGAPLAATIATSQWSSALDSLLRRPHGVNRPFDVDPSVRALAGQPPVGPGEGGDGFRPAL
jgi:hypothetical protein